MRSELDRIGVTEYERYVTYLTAYSESDFYNDRSQKMQDGVSYTVGMFQQSAKWGWTGLTDIRKATREFVDALRKVPFPKGDSIVDAWQVQHWNAPDPSIDYTEFLKSPETRNYIDRKNLTWKIMENPRYFSEMNNG